MLERKVVHVQYLPTHEKIADIFTKPLGKNEVRVLLGETSLVEINSLVEREC
jgi:hypothetical protein